MLIKRGLSGEGGEIIEGWKSGRYKLLGVRYAQGCIVQHGEYSQYFVITKGSVTFKIILTFKIFLKRKKNGNNTEEIYEIGNE